MCCLVSQGWGVVCVRLTEHVVSVVEAGRHGSAVTVQTENNRKLLRWHRRVKSTAPWGVESNTLRGRAVSQWCCCPGFQNNNQRQTRRSFHIPTGSQTTTAPSSSPSSSPSASQSRWPLKSLVKDSAEITERVLTQEVRRETTALSWSCRPTSLPPAAGFYSPLLKSLSTDVITTTLRGNSFSTE